ncbi:MAG: hypothetical protein RI947_758 [Candidatus Parcubacteria bacterium]|jgi:hypothetical protein
MQLLPALPVYAQTTWANCSVDGVPTLKCFEIIYENVLTITSGFIILALFIMLLMGGYNYLTSFGSPDKVKKAQTTIKFALYGFMLYISAFLILRTISYLFLQDKGSLFKFEINDQGSP